MTDTDETTVAKTNLSGDNPTQTNKGKSRLKSKKSRAQRFKDKQRQQADPDKPRPDYKPILKENNFLEKYYKNQPIIDDGEFEIFMAGLRETLPANFRINTFDEAQAMFLRKLVEGPELNVFLKGSQDHENQSQDCDKQTNLESPEEPNKQEQSAVLVPLSWYPAKLAWQMNITRVDLRKNPTLQRFHKFLQAETDNGFISRQEAVSMIPPLVLDVKRGHDILDMCAAPGSKTAQLVEYLKYDIMSSHPHKPTEVEVCFDDGMVVANDVDNKRCYMLVHQSNRLNSPNCIIINQDASRLPDMKTLKNDGSEEVIKFDRILCDVPCSGDGTVRKNPDVWKKWSVGNANNFHGMQCKILKRGIEMLKKDGLLVYSTCSMNPVEDEAVISNILRISEGDVILQDIEHLLPNLKYKVGTNKWSVMRKEMDIIPSVDAIPQENITQIYPSLFPPSQEEADKFNLHKCLRILPHLQNTGGFFVAVLRKLCDKMPWEARTDNESATDNKTDTKTRAKPPNAKKPRYGGFKEDPFFFMDESDPDWPLIKNGYGLSEKFPVTQLAYRCATGKKRSIYLVSKRTRQFIKANQEEPNKKDFVKIINGGMRLFIRADTEAGFRICQDGVNEVLPFVKDDIKVDIDKDDLVALLKSRTVQTDELKAGSMIKDKIKPGSFILIYKHRPSEESEWLDMPLVAWKGEWTIALYVSNTYRVHLCALAQLRMGDDIFESAKVGDNKRDQKSHPGEAVAPQ